MSLNNDSSNFRSQYYYQLGVKSFIITNPSQLLTLPLSQLQKLCIQNTQFPLLYRGRVLLKILEIPFYEDWMKIIGSFEEIIDKLDTAIGSSFLIEEELFKEKEDLLVSSSPSETLHTIIGDDSTEEDASSTSDTNSEAKDALLNAMKRLEARMEENLDPLIVDHFWNSLHRIKNEIFHKAALNDKIPIWLYGRKNFLFSIIDMTLNLWQFQIEAWELSLDSVNYNGWTSKGRYLRNQMFESVDLIKIIDFKPESRDISYWRSSWELILETIRESEMKHQYFMYLSFSKLLLKIVEKDYFMLGDWEEFLGKCVYNFYIMCSETHKRIFLHLKKLSNLEIKTNNSISHYISLLPSIWTKEYLENNPILLEIHAFITECFLKWFSSLFSIILPYDTTLLMWSVIFSKQPLEFIPCLALAIIDSIRFVLPNLTNLEDIKDYLTGEQLSIPLNSKSINPHIVLNTTQIDSDSRQKEIFNYEDTQQKDIPKPIKLREWKTDDLINKSVGYLKNKGQIYQDYHTRVKNTSTIINSPNQDSILTTSNLVDIISSQNKSQITSSNQVVLSRQGSGGPSNRQSNIVTSLQQQQNTKISTFSNSDISNQSSGVKILPTRLLGKSSNSNSTSLMQIRNIISPNTKNK